MKTRVVIIQGYNTPYRNELFNLISDYEDIDLTLLYISRRGEDRKWNDEMPTRFKEVQVQCDIKQISYVDTLTSVDYFDLVKKVYQIKPDVVISILCKYSILINYLIFWRAVKLIHWSEATLVTSKSVNCFNKKYLQWHFNLPKAFLFPGKMAREYHEYCGLGVENKTFYAPNSIDEIYTISEQEMVEKYARIKPLKLLFVGSFVELKGFHVLCSVFNILKTENYDFELHIAGDGPIKPPDTIFNHGYLNKDKAIELYKSSHVFIMPSLWDCNPLSLIEAAKTGNVLVASKGVGNYPELVNGNGYEFEIGNEDDLYGQLVKLLSKTSAELLEMGKKSIELASEISHLYSARSFYDAIKFATGNQVK